MSNQVELKADDAWKNALQFMNGVFLTIGQEAIVAGSIRRRKPVVHDVDLVFPPVDQDKIAHLKDLCDTCAGVTIHRWGPKMASLTYFGVPFDLYFSTPETFATLLLIRTGSKENNIRLCSIAKAKGWKLHASGDGLFNEKGERIAGNSERSIYEALGLSWQEPWERG